MQLWVCWVSQVGLWGMKITGKSRGLKESLGWMGPLEVTWALGWVIWDHVKLSLEYLQWGLLEHFSGWANPVFNPGLWNVSLPVAGGLEWNKVPSDSSHSRIILWLKLFDFYVLMEFPWISLCLLLLPSPLWAPFRRWNVWAGFSLGWTNAIPSTIAGARFCSTLPTSGALL